MDFAMTLVSTAFTVLVTLTVTAVFNHVKEKHKKEDEKTVARDNLLIGLARVQLIEYHDKYMAKGYIPSYVLENYELMYKAYKSLGGNGMITRMHEEILKLPVNQWKGEDD